MPLFKPNITNGLVIGGNEIGLSDDDIVNFIKVQDGSSTYVSASEALINSDIYSIVFQLSSDLATSVLHADDNRMQSLIDNPNGNWSNTHSFWQSVFAQLLLGGEAFAYRWRNVNGTDQRWEYLRPSQVSVFALQDYSGLFYNVTFDSPEVGVIQNIPVSDMIHFRLLSQNGGATGVSPLRSLASELAIKKSSNNLTLSALAKSVMAPGILKIDTGLVNSETKSAISRKFVQQMTSSGNGPVVIDKLADYTPLEVKGDVSKLLAQTDWTSKQIAKAYGVPDSILNGTGDQQSSLQMIGGEYAKSLTRYSSAIVSELKNKLNTRISMDIKPAIDPVNDDYTTNIATFQQNGLLSAEQAQWLLKNSGYLPQDMPEYEPNGKEDTNNDPN
ncbi:phage portal protein [Convivina intestini]|uniref:phage portal protein n=1 Tax=Convivina intestini TaxID=1505726 RepID=UPI0020103B40|nr:phage portal protein [Convivina intestini]CAH1857517.1 hypothetical protein R077811_01547 [Convivina intestini]